MKEIEDLLSTYFFYYQLRSQQQKDQLMLWYHQDRGAHCRPARIAARRHALRLAAQGEAPGARALRRRAAERGHGRGLYCRSLQALRHTD